MEFEMTQLKMKEKETKNQVIEIILGKEWQELLEKEFFEAQFLLSISIEFQEIIERLLKIKSNVISDTVEAYLGPTKSSTEIATTYALTSLRFLVKKINSELEITDKSFENLLDTPVKEIKPPFKSGIKVPIRFRDLFTANDIALLQMLNAFNLPTKLQDDLRHPLEYEAEKLVKWVEERNSLTKENIISESKIYIFYFLLHNILHVNLCMRMFLNLTVYCVKVLPNTIDYIANFLAPHVEDLSELIAFSKKLQPASEMISKRYEELERLLPSQIKKLENNLTGSINDLTSLKTFTDKLLAELKYEGQQAVKESDKSPLQVMWKKLERVHNCGNWLVLLQDSSMVELVTLENLIQNYYDKMNQKIMVLSELMEKLSNFFEKIIVLNYSLDPKVRLRANSVESWFTVSQIPKPSFFLESPISKSKNRLIEFKLADFINANTIYIAGTFNRWLGTEKEGKLNIDEAEKKWKMKRIKNKKGKAEGWRLSAFLPIGEYEYKYVIDKELWFPDVNQKISVRSTIESTKATEDHGKESPFHGKFS